MKKLHLVLIIVAVCLLIGSGIVYWLKPESDEIRLDRWNRLSVEDVKKIRLETNWKRRETDDKEIINFFINSLKNKQIKGSSRGGIDWQCELFIYRGSGRRLKSYLYLEYPTYNFSMILEENNSFLENEIITGGRFVQPIPEKARKFLEEMDALEK